MERSIATMRAWPTSWEAFAEWPRPARRLEWSVADAWRSSLDAILSSAATTLVRLLARWDERLADLGGDPAHEDWESFRPLRLSREEDWSDWLAHLLASAKTGRFTARLFGESLAQAERWRVADCIREFVAEDSRADLVLRFFTGDWAEIEVKVGDLHLAKTPGTGAAVRRCQEGPCRAEYLLLPAGDVKAWEEERAGLSGRGDGVVVRTWTDVAKALRDCLIERSDETLSWCVWARTFLGAVEQRLLGFPPIPAGPVPPGTRSTAKTLERIAFLESVEVQ